MSLAAQTANAASNWNRSLTLSWFIGVLEKSHERFAPESALEMINEHLSSLERQRLALLDQDRIKKELETNPQLTEVMT